MASELARFGNNKHVGLAAICYTPTGYVVDAQPVAPGERDRPRHSESRTHPVAGRLPLVERPGPFHERHDELRPTARGSVKTAER